jgi:hypothetical protein
MTSQNIIDQPHYIDEMNENRLNRDNNYRPVSQSENTNTNTQQQESPGLFFNLIVRPIKWIGSFFCTRDSSEINSADAMFEGLPDVVDSIPNFINGIKTKVGLLILYSEEHHNYFEELIRNIKQQDYIIDILVMSVNLACQLYNISINLQQY